MSADIRVVHSDEQYVEYAATLADPVEWMQEESYRPELVRRLLLLIAEYGEDEISYALGCAIIGQECRRRGTLKLN